MVRLDRINSSFVVLIQNSSCVSAISPAPSDYRRVRKLFFLNFALFIYILLGFDDSRVVRDNETFLLGQALTRLVNEISPEHHGRRRNLLLHLVDQFLDRANPNYSLSHLLTHPSLQEECRLYDFAIAVADDFITERQEEEGGQRLIDAVAAQGRGKYNGWIQPFPAEAQEIREGAKPEGKPLRIKEFNNKDGLPWITRLFRNKAVHCGDLIQTDVGESLGRPPISYVRNWNGWVPTYFTDLWVSVTSAGLTGRFPCYFGYGQ